jgi:transcription antitermination factor NusG
MTPAWYAVYTAPQQEDRVYRALMFGKGVHVWLPKRRYWVRHARRKEQKERPLFPRYLFACIQQPGEFSVVRGTPGVQSFVGCDGYARSIPDPVIDGFMDLESVGTFDETRERPKTRREKLRPVLEGKLGDLAARLQAAFEDEAIAVLLAEAGIVDARRAREAA